MPNDLGSSIESVILDSLWYHQYNIQHVFGLAVIVFNFTRRKVTGKLVEIIFDFDQKADKVGWAPKSQKVLFVVVVLTFVASVVMTSVASALYAYKYNWIQSIPAGAIAFNILNYGVILLFFLMVSQQFIVSAFCVRSRLESVTKNFW